MRGFLGITAHFMDLDRRHPRVQSVLLSCERITGSHTGERISEKFEEVCDNFNIKHKLGYNISDNASNMKKAFTVCFPSATSSEDGDLWEDVNEDYQDDVESIQSSCRQKRLHIRCSSLCEMDSNM